MAMGGGDILLFIYVWHVMETNCNKVLYEAPSTMIIEVKHGGVICDSNVRGGNAIKEWEDGGTTDEDVFM